MTRHGSLPHNPNIANAFFRSGQIETWGRGIEKIETACHDAGVPSPIFTATSTEVRVAFPFSTTMTKKSPPNDHSGEQVIEQVVEDVSEQVARILRAARNPISRADLLNAAGLADAYLNYRNHIVPLLEQGLLARTIPDRPRAHTQRYVTTEIGLAILVNSNNPP